MLTGKYTELSEMSPVARPPATGNYVVMSRSLETNNDSTKHANLKLA